MKKKLLIVGRGNEIGGGTEYLITLIKTLHKHFDVDIHMTYGKEEVKNNYEKHFNYVTFHHVPMVREIKPISDFNSIKCLYKLMKKEKFDVVHTNSSKGGIVGRIASKIAKIPFVFHTVHGFSFHEQSSKLSITIFSLLEKIGAKCCDYIITVSDFHKDWAIKLKIAPQEKIIAIPNGLDPSRVKPSIDRDKIRTSLKIDEDEIAIFTIGRLAKQKGIEYLLGSLALLEQEKVNNKYHIYIAGSGELEEELKNKTVELNIKEKVTFLGHRSDVNNLLSASDIMVLPSLWEGLSIALLEAMAAKKAIICTDIGSNMTVIEDKKEALVVKSKDSVGLKENIKLLIEDAELRNYLAEMSNKKFMAEFSKNSMVERYSNFYKHQANISEKITYKDAFK
ncbi:glycosyltransferase family 4 protein [Priestia megaterium]|uniref:glycosyltransferase family 4 protein n=1 Tax=Priestia megaterium TaxID=1404 RepID=UPI00234F3927|nr:glycosyltransferase family 4 protein [Priestia megaterium]MDC7783891.1 glycosyltransferase family 4 protein [Priestia megaterium]